MIAALRRRSNTLTPAAVAMLVVFGGFASARAALDPNEWKHRQEFVVSDAGLTKISLPAETLDLASEGLADLRLVGPNHQEVAYVIEVAKPPSQVTIPARGFRVELQKLATQLTIETGTNGLVEGIQLATPAGEFIKAARLEISADGSRWETLSDGIQLARGRQLDQRTIRFGKTTAAFVRVTIDDWRTPAVPFTGATILVAPANAGPSLAVDAQISKRDEFANETVLKLSLPRHLPLAAVEFGVRDQIFSRSVRLTERRLVDGESAEHLLASGFVSRYTSARETPREQLRLPVNASTHAREVEVHIDNGNNAPLAIETVRVARRPVWLTFNADVAGSYAILTGRADTTPPHYDLAVFGDDVRLLAETPVTIAAAAENSAFRPNDRLAETPLLGATLDISKWNYRKAVTVVAPGVQELELDPEVLAQAQPGLGDIRLTTDGRQVPYVIERTSLSRELSLTTRAEDTRKQPGISRWTATLPVEHLPISRVTLTSSTALFSRSVQLFETVRDERGEVFRRMLSSPTQWNVTPDRAEKKLTIVPFNTAETKTLELDIDNGDNPPIGLASVAADYPVIRLLFRSDQQSIQIHYGAAQVTAPRYDLQLVANHLLNQERQQAKAGPEERVDAASATAFFRMRGGVLLWAALGLVVVVLLVVIARLLPKPVDSSGS